MNTPTYSLEQRDETTAIVWGPNAAGQNTNLMTLWFDGAYWHRVHAYGAWATLEAAAEAAIVSWAILMERVAR